MVNLIENGEDLVSKWGAALEGINDSYTRKVVATLYENQAKAIILDQSKKINEANAVGFEGATTTGSLGTFQKFAFPLIRRVYPQLIANSIVSQQPMQGPVGQVFYLGSGRQYGSTREGVYSKYQLTYGGLTASAIGANSADGDAAVQLSTIYGAARGSASTTFGGKIAAWPQTDRIHGYSISAGEFLSGSAIPEVNLTIEQQPIVARTRKMRTLWTIEASQDLKAYHNLDLEQELTELMGNELRLEIDRELLENLRGIAYDSNIANGLGGWYRNALDLGNSQSIGNTGGADSFNPAKFMWDYNNSTGGITGVTNPSGAGTNVWVIDFSQSSLAFNPQHIGQVWSNMWAVLNLMSQDIYKTTHRGPGTWICTSPLVGAMLETAAQLGGGMGGNGGSKVDGPTNMGGQIQFKGKLGGKYDLYIDPLWPEDEILMGYKGSGPMDTGFVYAPYIPIENLPTVVDPATFQPRKGIMTRYGMLAIAPEAKFYRILRIIGPTANYLYQPFRTTTGNLS
jgi:hypothetical protein